VTEFAPENASLAERLDHFFTVELPGDPELTAQYGADPEGTLEQHFSDLPADVLADAMFHLGQSTTASFATAARADQFDGESDFAFALRTSSDSGIDPGEFGSAAATGADPGFDPNAGMDPLLDGVFDTPLAGTGAEFGFGGTAGDVDPALDSSFETFSGGDSGHTEPGPDDSGDSGGDWEGDLSDNGLDDEPSDNDGDPLDPGLPG
jgi:hypothetical protein